MTSIGDTNSLKMLTTGDGGGGCPFGLATSTTSTMLYSPAAAAYESLPGAAHQDSSMQSFQGSGYHNTMQAVDRCVRGKWLGPGKRCQALSNCRWSSKLYCRLWGRWPATGLLTWVWSSLNPAVQAQHTAHCTSRPSTNTDTHHLDATIHIWLPCPVMCDTRKRAPLRCELCCWMSVLPCVQLLT